MLEKGIDKNNNGDTQNGTPGGNENDKTLVIDSDNILESFSLPSDSNHESFIDLNLECILDDSETECDLDDPDDDTNSSHTAFEEEKYNKKGYMIHFNKYIKNIYYYISIGH